ncbi:unnamed protein product [Angiostrongylus costaricensis]|uniref:Protein kinase domain-containing protein n=1 Tax=Angiostrongylus costaricensis TaxID=334426 RepID=A0A0R3PJ12_ANGCS|nr:unnamed protein product [Angiostrongylus costaricensis]
MFYLKARKGQQKEVVVSVLHDPDGKCKTLNDENKLEAVELTLKRGIRLAKWEYSPQSVQVGKLITTVTYGEIREGKLTKTDGTVIDVAIKVMKGPSETCKQQTKEMVKEARLMRNLNHTNIIRFYGVCLLEQPIYLLFELLSGGPLDVYLMKHKQEISKDERLQMVMSVGWGLEYLHSNAILHRDIAAKSCFYSVGKLVKISEFGLSRQGTIYSMKTARKMSIKWMAPESLRTLMFTQKSDVYSYGVLIYEVFSCAEPYPKLTVNAAKNAVSYCICL